MLGSLPAVPFLWAWESVLGSTGIILFSRVLASLGVVACVYVTYRAVAGRLPRVPLLVAVASTAMWLPYSITAVSYNTVPMFGLLVATFAGFRVSCEYSRKWAVVTSLAAAASTVAFPAVALGSVTLLLAVAVLCLRHEVSWTFVVRDLVLPGLVLGLLVVGWLAVSPGLDAVRKALQLQSGMRPRATKRRLIDFAVITFRDFRQSGPLQWALLSAVCAALLPRPALRWTATLVSAVLLIVLAVTKPDYAGTTGLLIAMTWLPIAIRSAVHDAQYRRLLLLSTTSLLAAAGVQVLTASGPWYGAAMDGAAAFVAVVVLGFCLACRREMPARLQTVRVLAAALPMLVAAACLTAVAFEDGGLRERRELVSRGPAAGLWLTPGKHQQLQRVEAMVSRCPRGGKVFVTDLPGLYVWFAPSSAAVISWTRSSGLNRLPVQKQLDRRADCVVASSTTDREAQTAADLAVQSTVIERMRPVGPRVRYDERTTLRMYVRPD